MSDRSRPIGTRGQLLAAGITIPPARRVIVDRCSPACRSCQRWTRSGGGCPGVAVGRERRRPLCHSEARRYWEPVVEEAGG